MRRQLLGVILLAALATGGCLQRETTHTIYLAPDGRATWMVVEADVHSDERDPGRRDEEEQRYLTAVATGDHGMARGLAALDATAVVTRIVRDRRPFVVITEAEFTSLEVAIRRMLLELDVPGNVACTKDGAVTTLTVQLDIEATEGRDGPETPVVELFENLDRYRFVLTDGRFVRATGFELREGGRVAVPIETPPETIEANGGVLELSLAWQ